jgi:glyoxylase-like metal-dependent hydrolase (beta-lactamase superfamily II)
MTVSKFTTNNGRTIYQFSVRAFPELIANIHIIQDGQHTFLVDCGSGLPDSNQQLLDGFQAIRNTYDETISLETLDGILLTHGHIDHFGGLPFVRQFSQAPVGIHQLDVRVVSNYEERRVVAARRLEIYLEQAGLGPTTRENMMAIYLFAKGLYRSQEVQFFLQEGEPFHDIHFFHVPGHCPGHVAMLVDDVMLTADHILGRITPHQAPESITLNMGLGHYLDSLDKIGRVPNIRLGLGGHERPIEDVYGRIEEIKASHNKRLDKVMDICATPKTIAQVSKELFGVQHTYHVLLALEEAGAHVEYLYERGELVAANVAEIEQTTHPVIQYVRGG